MIKNLRVQNLFTQNLNDQNYKAKTVAFRGAPLVKVCGVHDKPSILAAISAARESVEDRKAPELIKYIREMSYSSKTPVKIAFVTHLKNSGKLINIINNISEEVHKDPNTIKTTNQVFDIIQIHDDMPIKEIEKVKKTFPEIKIIKAVHVPKKGDSYNLNLLINNAVNLAKNSSIDGLLLDSSNLAKNQIGGTGLTNNWSVAQKIIDSVHKETGKPVALAGGLSPNNVSSAIKTTHADMVDANSGYRFDRKDGNGWHPIDPDKSAPKDPFAILSVLTQMKNFDTKFNQLET